MDEKIWISPKLDPSLDEAETPLWFWNAPLEEEELVRQLKLQTEIETNPLLGVNLGGGYKKLRLNISSKNKGKSGGARVITHEIIISIKEENDTKSVLFVSIYDKSDFESIDITLLENYVNEFRENEVNKSKEKK